MLHQLWVRFIIASQFLTRIPIHNLVNYDQEQAKKSPIFYPLVGLIVGFFCFAVFSGFATSVSDNTAILVSMIATIWLTGALHEDGFADCCDGFGGGWKKEDILRIMKDSRLGAYGAIGLFAILSLKFQLLIEIPTTQLLVALAIGHGLSRFFAISFMHKLNYAQIDNNSKVESHVAALSKTDLCFALGPILILFFWLPIGLLVFLAIALCFSYLLLKRMFVNKIGGYTGDCLGAAQQISEILVYMVFAFYF